MTDTEAKVRQIAAWMGLKNVGEWGERGLKILSKSGWPDLFAPHLNSQASAADRERMVQNLLKNVFLSAYQEADVWYVGLYLFDKAGAWKGQWSVANVDYAAGFCEAFVAWIDAQKGGGR